MRVKMFSCMARVGFLIALSAMILFSGCSKNKNAYRQHYVDVTERFLPRISGTLKNARFAYLDEGPYQDLIVHRVDNAGRSQILLLINKEKGGYRFHGKNKTVKAEKGEILFFSVGDFNADRADDLILIQSKNGRSFASLLFNNKKGYFYKKVDYVFPEIRQGIERVEVADLDHDGDRDLFFHGKRVLNPEGRADRMQAQTFINNGKGDFQDLSGLLLPALSPGIAGAAIADYDGDGIRDIFLIYEKARNRLLLNNSLGKFSDVTLGRLPAVNDASVHVDWADFDGDEDNDLLVVNRGSAPRGRAHSGETGYFLENDGKGRFTMRPHKMFPGASASRVYLLDANGNGIPDALILSAGKTRYFQGKGKWKFSAETVQRLPRSLWIMEMAFGDIDDDGYLDIFGVDSRNGKGKLWLNKFK